MSVLAVVYPDFPYNFSICVLTVAHVQQLLIGPLATRREIGTELVAAAARQLDALLQYRAAPTHHRMYLITSVLRFYEEIERPHMYIRWVTYTLRLFTCPGLCLFLVDSFPVYKIQSNNCAATCTGWRPCTARRSTGRRRGSRCSCTPSCWTGARRRCRRACDTPPRRSTTTRTSS